MKILLIVTLILVTLFAIGTRHPQPQIKEGKVLYSQPIVWHGMHCTEEADVTGNLWINDCYTKD